MHTAQRRMRGKSNKHLIFLPALCCLLMAAAEARAVDEENCLFCHKYRGLSYIDEHSDFTLLYITEDVYVNSPHGVLKCTDCHEDIEKYPHEDHRKVDCLTVCHVDEPSTGLPFSHENVGTFLSKSVHSPRKENGALKKYHEDYPDCTTCHHDPQYRPLTFVDMKRPVLKTKTVQRCSVCHENTEFLNKFYNHFTSRMQKLRNPHDLVEMCSSCHADTDMMDRHGKEHVVKSYMETYHGKAVFYGNEAAADCTDCHVLPGKNVHAIHSTDDPQAATYKDNIYKTCSAVGCHPDAELNLAGYKAHVIVSLEKNPVEFAVIIFFTLLTLGSFLPLILFTVLDMARHVFPNAALFKTRAQRNEKD